MPASYPLFGFTRAYEQQHVFLVSSASCPLASIWVLCSVLDSFERIFRSPHCKTRFANKNSRWRQCRKGWKLKIINLLGSTSTGLGRNDLRWNSSTFDRSTRMKSMLFVFHGVFMATKIFTSTVNRSCRIMKGRLQTFTSSLALTRLSNKHLRHRWKALLQPETICSRDCRWRNNR